jgi:N-acetylneuraminic acid mutarotase
MHHHHSLFLPTWTKRVWTSVISLLGATLLVCLPAGAIPARAQQWSQTGSLGTARSQPTASLLANGKVLVAGGISVLNPCCSMTATAELYDPATGQWSTTGSLSAPRFNHIAVRLANGKVLVAGGNRNSFSTSLSTAEIYDADTGAWSATGNLSVARASHTATLLADGRVLVTGGFSGGLALNSVEVYDPTTGAWSATGTMNSARYYHAATLLANGKVLVAAGTDDLRVLSTAELYDPATGSWTTTGDLIAAREAPTATLVHDGKVLVTGGADDQRALDTAELYDPATGQWRTTGRMTASRVGHTATLLPTGKVLVAAGYEGPVNSAELYDPGTGSWSVTGSLNTVRATHTATLLVNGKVLVTGGGGVGASSPRSAELFTDNDTSANPIDAARFFVRQHYLDFLNREPDQSGWDFWTDNLTSCGSDANCIDVKRVNVSAAFYLSIEFQQTGYLVEREYKTAYGDGTGTSTLNGTHVLAVPIVRFIEFLPDMQQSSQGVILGQTGWETRLENNKQAFTAQFVQRSRFTSALPTSMTPTQFVDQLNQNAANVLSSTERDAAIALFGGAADTTNITARAAALLQIAENQNLYNAEFNRAFVLMQYFGYLRRNPNDPHDGDYTGFDFWLTKLNQFNGNYSAAEMVKAFITSIEYRQRFGP